MHTAAHHVGLSQHESVLYQLYQHLHRVWYADQQQNKEWRMQLLSQLQLQLQPAWTRLFQASSRGQLPRQLVPWLYTRPPHDLPGQLHVARQLMLLVQPNLSAWGGWEVEQLQQQANAQQEESLQQLLMNVVQLEAAAHQARVQDSMQRLEATGLGEQQHQEPDMEGQTPKRQCQ